MPSWSSYYTCITWSSRPVMSCVLSDLYRFPHRLPKNETIRLCTKCQVWVVQRVCWPPSLPRWHLLHQIKSGPATLWVPVLVLVGGLWTFLDKGDREAPTDIADPQSRHWRKETHTLVWILWATISWLMLRSQCIAMQCGWRRWRRWRQCSGDGGGSGGGIANFFFFSHWAANALNYLPIASCLAEMQKC